MTKRLTGFSTYTPKIGRREPKLTGLHGIKRVGFPTAFGDLIDYGDVHAARVIVGLNRGIHAGLCADYPKKMDPENVDMLFIGLRGIQVGRKNVGATRALAAGWYEGEPEDSIVYEVINTLESESAEKFQANLDSLGQELAVYTCQKEVLVVHRRPGEEFTHSLTFEEK